MGFNDFFKGSNEAATVTTLDLRKELEKRSNADNIFPLDIFHPKIKPFINELHTKFDIPRSYIGLSMLLTYSSAIGTAYAVSRNGDDEMYMSVWAVMNGISSSGKSFALDQCLKPLVEIQNEFDAEWVTKTDGATDVKRQFIRMDTVIYRDAYIPTLIRAIMPVNPKGVLKESDEILEWINGLNQLGNKESADEQFWISAWNARKYSAVRSGNLKIMIPRVFTNVVGGIQPKLLYKLFKNERGDSGFIFRCLFAIPETFKIARPVHGYSMPPEYRAMHTISVQKMYKDLPVQSGTDKPKICLMSKEATKIIAAWEDDKINKINTISDINEMNIHSGILGKIKEYAYRFAGIIAVSDRAFDMQGLDYFPNELLITPNHINRALQAAEYFYKSAVDIYETVDNSVTAPYEVLYISSLVKMGKSVRQMAELVYGSPKHSTKMHRTIKKAIQEYPKVFGAINKG